MRDFMTIVKALADENRIRAIMALSEGELCVCEIIALLGLAPSTVSKHLSILYQAGFLDSRKDGRWVYYRLAGDGASLPVTRAVEWVTECLKNDKEIIMDRQCLKNLICHAPSELSCSKGKTLADSK